MIRVPHPIRLLFASLIFLSALGMPIGRVQADARNLMMEAMLRMMEAMGIFEPRSVAAVPPSPVPLPPSPWTPGAPSNEPTEGSATRPTPSQAMEAGVRMMTQGSEASKPRAPLDGVWEGRDGELLIVEGNRFRIYSGAAPHVDGYLRVQRDQVALYHPGDGSIRPFDFAEYQGRLVLRDRSGNLYLYRKLWWDPQAAGDAHFP